MRLRYLFIPVALACSCAAIVKSDIWSADLIKVPHPKHAAASVGCATCHEDVADSKSLSDDKGARINYRPAETKCMECHQEKDKGNCQMCHTSTPAELAKAEKRLAKADGTGRELAYPKRDVLIKMNHKDHIERVGGEEHCDRCHKVLPEPTRRRDYVPTMGTCLECHNHQEDYNEGRCERCHTDLSHYPIKPVSDFSHQGDWIKNHGRQARVSSDTCALCHEQTYCTDCHAKATSLRIEIKNSDRVLSDFIHRGDWQSRHSLEARYDEASCKRCHGTSFCVSCHSAQNLTPGATNPRDPHPPGWSSPGSPNSHGAVARRDITACAACHDQGAASNCVNCHKVGGVGGTPHPPGWSDHHPRAEINTNGMCRYCHAQ